MKNLKIILALLLAGSLVLSSCSKKDDAPAGPAEGTMSATVDGKSVSFNVNAIHYKMVVDTKTYEYIAITGSNGTSQADMTSFVVTVYSSKLETKTYPVPTYNETYTYDFWKGYAMGYYFKGANSTDYYYSYMAKKSAGSITIESISTTAIKGSYDMTLVNNLDNSKTIPLKGNFNAKIIYRYGF